MDDLMNRICALIEGHVKAEVDARAGRDFNEYETRLVALFGATNPRDIVESVERAVKERDELREQVQALELKLLEVRKVVADEARAPVEVDGFRVGDLVRCGSKWVPVQSAFNKGAGHRGLVIVDGEAVRADCLTRKPVEVGDTVRHIYTPSSTGVVLGVHGWKLRARLDTGEVREWSCEMCFPVAP